MNPITTGRPLAGVIVSGNSATPLSETATSPIESTGSGSSSAIVATPVPSAMVAPLGADSTTAKASSNSSSESPRTLTGRGIETVPGVNVSVPDPAA